MQKIFIITIPLLFISCNQQSMVKMTPENTLYANSEKEGTGGNNEVYNIHLCFKKETIKGQKLCLDEFYPKEKRVNIYLAQNTLKTPISTRDSDIKLRQFNLKDKDKFILHIPIENIEEGISTNIEGAKIYQDEQSITITIDTKLIKEKVIIYNKNSEILESYSIIK